jgi:hypothetical protein
MWVPLTALLETMHRRVCPLYTFDDARRVQVLGSAVPFDSGGLRFLVTATHVALNSRTRLGVPLFTMGHEAPLFLGGRRISWAYEPGATPDIDLTLIELREEEAADLEKQYHFTTPAETTMTRPKTPGIHYVIAGYPAVRNRFVSPKHYPSARATHLLTGDIGGVEELDLPDKAPDYHFSVHLPFDEVPKADGGKFRVPKPQGMSGGGVWLLDIDMRSRLASTPLLVGIGSEYHKSKRLFVAMRIHAAIPLLHDLIDYVQAGVWPKPG